MPDFGEIKRKYNILDVATKTLGLELRSRGNGEFRGISIAPGTHTHDNGLSINVNTGEWIDFSTSTGGDVIDLVAAVKFGGVDNSTRLEAAKFLDGDNSKTSGHFTAYTAKRVNFENDVEKWHKALLNDERTLNYLHERRITDETIERFKLGIAELFNGKDARELRLVCPYLDRFGSPKYYASRQLSWTAKEGSEKYVKCSMKHGTDIFFKNQPFGLNTLKDSGDTLCIGEGMFDGLSLTQEGFAILFSIGGDFGKENTAQVIDIANTFRRIFTVYDIDGNESGQRFTCKIGRQLMYGGLPFRAVTTYGEGNKDVSDYYSNGGNLRELLEDETRTINGYVFMSRFTFWQNTPKELDCSFDRLSSIEKKTALSEIKQFVYRLKTFLSPVEFSEVVEALSGYYPEDKVRQYAKGPTDQELMSMSCDSFLDGKHIFFYGSIRGGSYWQYNNGGYWTRETDAAMQSKISEFFSHKKSIKTVSNLATMVRLKDTRRALPDFNSKRLWLFQNGVLELDTGILREPTPYDYLTWQVSYRYEPNATCPKFDTFIKQVTCDDISRENLIDDMLGYILYADNHLEKIFCLIGDGMNGKGVLLSVIEALAKSVNAQADMPSVTNVPLKDFAQPTQLIMLNGSLVNLSYDLDQNLKDCEGALKSVSSGDTINGNRKFCDSVSFKPRCKLINASNHMIRVRDNSFGMRRRLAFCRFDACFKDKPNTNLKHELLSELSGIFNRMYRAYKALLEREKTNSANAIRLCVDQAEFIQEFTETASPVAAFWSECREDYLNLEVKKTDLFDSFKNWCEHNSRYAGSKSHFFMALKGIITDSGDNITETKPRESGKQVRCLYISGEPETETED